MDHRQIGQQIRWARLLRNMTQAQLAGAADLSAPYISHIERGRKHISLDALVRISKILDVTTDQLLGITRPGERKTSFPEIAALFADCTPRERRILRDVAAAVKTSLRELEKKKGG